MLYMLLVYITVTSFGHADIDFRYLITIISFLLPVYKEWLLTSLAKKIRKSTFPLTYFKHEQRLRKEIYLTNKIFMFF